MVALDAGGHVPGGGGGKHQEGIDDEDAHPLDADGHHDSQQRGEGALVEKCRDAPAPGEGGVDGEDEKPVVEEAPGDEDEKEDGEKAQKICRRDGEDIADEVAGVFVEAPAPRHEHEAQGDGCGGEYANDRIGRGPAPILDPGDEEGEEDGKDEERRQRAHHPQEHAQGDARKGPVAQGVGEEGHAV